MDREAPSENERVYAFGPFRLDAGERRLNRQGDSVPLVRKAFDLLLLLVADAGRLKTREELIAALWPKRIVEEQGLSARIHTLRRALGDEGETPQYIETVRGVGYRFIAPVAVEAASPARTAPRPAGNKGLPRRRLKLAIGASVAVAILVVAGLLAWHFVAHPPGGPETFVPQPSIAVLPFENLSADKNNEYFVAGIQDLILTKLADIGDLKVIARTSTAKYQSHPDDLKAIDQQLGVSTILEGSVQKQGNEVLINVQLIDARTDSHIWAQSYTRTLTNIFGIEGEVAGKIADALNAKLSPAQSAQLAVVPTRNRAAYDAFLRAEYLANKGHINYTTASWKAATPLYRRAVALDPNFALAWARLSWNESNLAWFGGAGEDVKQLEQQARADAERALHLQPKLAAAQLALGYCDYWGRRDYAGALEAFAAALALKPNDVDALAAQGYVERRQGHIDRAIASFEKALALDPGNSALARDLAYTYMSASRFADAMAASRRALELDPDNLTARGTYAYAILFGTGNIPRALAVVQGDDPVLKSARVGLLTLQRKYPEALALLDSIPDTVDNFGYAGSKAEQQADLYRLMGDETHARALYAQALPGVHAQLKVQQGINLAGTLQDVADVELGLGHTAEAMEAVGKSQAIMNQTVDYTSGPGIMVTGAALYAEARRVDLAVPLLAKALATPGIGANYAPVLLWLDPSWDPIRHDPSFQGLLKRHEKQTPISTTTASTTTGG